MVSPRKLPGVVSHLQASTFADLSRVPRFIPAGSLDPRGQRGNHGPGELDVRRRRPQLAGRVRVVRMFARVRVVRRRRLTITHPSQIGGEGRLHDSAGPLIFVAHLLVSVDSAPRQMTAANLAPKNPKSCEGRETK